MQLRRTSLHEDQIHQLLSNSRRSEALRQLNETGGTIPLRDLSDRLASQESGTSPPPQKVRESVYNSLHQTHLPKLEELGVVEYDREQRVVRLRKHAREVDLYMEVVTKHGVTWSEIYRGLAVLSLLTVLGSLLDYPGVGSVDTVLWTSLFLALFAILSLYQLWTTRYLIFPEIRNWWKSGDD
ncbi:DUF7344 domain-containing protein [Halomontanus rarus]|uniref:DUF7344 domain-containing protein n=1 Tax=Halomontanus rarus TaxID=3034020 RepID=UPI0023E85685|nr:hypothetical protein [Halovivax sp. TS33]